MMIKNGLWCTWAACFIRMNNLAQRVHQRPLTQQPYCLTKPSFKKNFGVCQHKLSLYASMLVPKDYAQATLMSSGIINGIATILLTLFIDPKASVLADRVMKNQSDYIYLKSYSLTMISSKLMGTIVAQLLFIPVAYYVAWFAKWI